MQTPGGLGVCNIVQRCRWDKKQRAKDRENKLNKLVISDQEKIHLMW